MEDVPEFPVSISKNIQSILLDRVITAHALSDKITVFPSENMNSIEKKENSIIFPASTSDISLPIDLKAIHNNDNGVLLIRINCFKHSYLKILCNSGDFFEQLKLPASKKDDSIDIWVNNYSDMLEIKIKQLHSNPPFVLKNIEIFKCIEY